MIQQSRPILKPLQLTVVAGSLLVALACAPGVRAAEETAPAAKAEATDAEDAAWQALKESAKPVPTPEAWKTTRPTLEEQKEYSKKVAESAGVTADKAAEFLTKYPKGSHAADARKFRVSSLQRAVMMGDDDRSEELTKVLKETAGDTSLPDNDRVSARMTQLQLQARKAEGEDGGTKAIVEGLLAIQKDFPKSAQVYSQMLSLAESREGAETRPLIKAVADSPDAPEKAKKRAQDILDGKVFSAAANIGKPIDIKFTAVDGTEVDLAKLKGKVVLVDFWATWCGPCVAEIPHVVEAYEKYHDKGFEIIGISFDREADKEKLVKFTKDKNMPWPQYFDGKQWENDFGQRFNIRGIPAMWLFDKNGNLADANARGNLADKVAKLLEAK